ncbi:IS110 family transposase, partial [Ornithobacterium rhinotracheale]
MLNLQEKNWMKSLYNTNSFLARQIETLESELEDLDSSEFDRQFKLITYIKGICITLATALIVATGG